MKPYVHSKNSQKHFGGQIEDYLHIHNWMDSTKAATANFYHRAILHNSFGPFLAEQVFGITMTNSDGKVISIRDIVEMHIKEDCSGKIPTIDDWLKDLQPTAWMVGRGQRAWVEHQGLEAD
jgi:hypothetical protein